MEDYFGIGIYSIPEASRLSGLDPARLRRWFKGYKYKSKSNKIISRPRLLHSDLPEMDDVLAISFNDLIEAYFIRAFVQRGVPMYVIRASVDFLKEELDSNHPFSSRTLKTNGKRIFQKKGDELIDTYSRNYGFSQILEPLLFDGMQYEESHLIAWHPNGIKEIVLNPEFSFGKPVITEHYIRTKTLFDAWRAENEDYSQVAKDFEIQKKYVEAAVNFEMQLHGK